MEGKKLFLGRRNVLQITRKTDFGLFLDCGEMGEVLLPNQEQLSDNHQIGDEVDVFLYLDNEERLVATEKKSKIEVNHFGCLEVKWVNEYGAFLDWGLMKDLFCPFREQRQRMEIGRRYVVYCYIDSITYRIVASAKVDKFLSLDEPPYLPGDEVDVLVQQRTDLGYKLIVDDRFGGMIFNNEVFQPLRVGDRMSAFVKQVRPDGKIDIQLQHSGVRRFRDFSSVLFDYIQSQPGCFTPLNDKSPAEEIYRVFGVSKKTFKRGAGDLFKRRLITITDQGLSLVRRED